MQELVLADLASEISREHELAEQAAKAAIGHALRCGELLLQVKAQVGHGQWLPWLEAKCPVGERQAQKYMRLAKHRERVNANPDSYLSIDHALGALAEPKAPADDPVDLEALLAFQIEKTGISCLGGALLFPWEDAVELFNPENYHLLYDTPAYVWPFLEKLARMAHGEAPPHIELYVAALSALGRTAELKSALVGAELKAKRQAGLVLRWLDENGEDVEAWLEFCELQHKGRQANPQRIADLEAM